MNNNMNTRGFTEKDLLNACIRGDKEEIAEILNLSVSAIYSKKTRITDKLKKIAKRNKILQEI